MRSRSHDSYSSVHAPNNRQSLHANSPCEIWTTKSGIYIFSFFLRIPLGRRDGSTYAMIVRVDRQQLLYIFLIIAHNTARSSLCFDMKPKQWCETHAPYCAAQSGAFWSRSRHAAINVSSFQKDYVSVRCNETCGCAPASAPAEELLPPSALPSFEREYITHLLPACRPNWQDRALASLRAGQSTSWAGISPGSALIIGANTGKGKYLPSRYTGSS